MCYGNRTKSPFAASLLKLTPVLGIVVLLSGPPARADSVTVGCEGAQGTFNYTSVTDALVALHAISHRDHLVTVSGTCTEYISVQDFEKLTISGTPGAVFQMPEGGTGPMLFISRSDAIVLTDLTIRGTETQKFEAVVRIAQKSDVQFERCVFERSPEKALFASDLTMVWLNRCLIQNNGTGVVLRSGSILFVGQVSPDPQPCVFRKNGLGIEVSYSSHGHINGNTVIENNGAGIAILGGQVNLCCGDGLRRLVNNDTWAIYSDYGTIINHGPLLVAGNGVGGVFLDNSSLRLVGGAQIRHNNDGIMTTQNSKVELWDVEITENTRYGLSVQSNSSVESFNSTITGNRTGLRLNAISTASLQGNTVRSNKEWDLFCSPNSFAQGEKSGIERVFCPAFDNSPDPTPIRPHEGMILNPARK